MKWRAGMEARMGIEAGKPSWPCSPMDMYTRAKEKPKSNNTTKWVVGIVVGMKSEGLPKSDPMS